jgi:NAD-dependent histone deacetylase SIR2
MTIFVPLEPSSELPAQSAFLLPSSNVHAQLSKAIQAIMKAKRIVIICGL